jgi:hypothetical protein
MEYKECCICHNTYEGFGNNPWPLMDTEDQCCDECNKQVVAIRIHRLLKTERRFSMIAGFIFGLSIGLLIAMFVYLIMDAKIYELKNRYTSALKLSTMKWRDLT